MVKVITVRVAVNRNDVVKRYEVQLDRNYLPTELEDDLDAGLEIVLRIK